MKSKTGTKKGNELWLFPRVLLLAVFVCFSACGSPHKVTKPTTNVSEVSKQKPVIQEVVVAPQPPKILDSLSDIDTFTPTAASEQALEVLKNNRYTEEFFEEVFDKVVFNLKENKKKKNADVIWEKLIAPLKRSGKVPPDIATRTWNFYFSSDFVSLPEVGSIDSHCSKLAEVKSNLHKEYEAKKKGFAICNIDSPSNNFLKAMYVYNTLWASCNPPND